MVASSLLLVIVYGAFVSLGLPDGALGVAWPAMRAELGRPLEALGLVTILATLGSALSGFASGRVLARLGTPRVVLFSGMLTGLALLGFALAPSYLLVVLLALPLGFGGGSVDAGLNHFAAERYASRHMNWLHASWGVGATIGPLVMTAAIAGGAASVAGLGSGAASAAGGGTAWRLGYFIISAAQLTLALVFLLTLGLWKLAPPRKADGLEGHGSPGGRRPASRLAIWLGPASYFLYAGIEVGLGLWAASVMREGRGFEASQAGAIAAAYYGSITVGRFLSGIVADRIGNRRMARAGLSLAGLGVLVFALPLGPAGALVGLVLTGLGLAPVYPCLMHETPSRFDADTTRKVVGRQVASAYVGGAILPPLVGLAGAVLGLWAVAPLVAFFVLAMGATVVALDRAT